MLVVALILIVAIPLVAGSIRAVPAGSVGLIERLGRLLPGIHKPGIVAVRPFVDRLIVIPAGPFSIRCDFKADIAGAPRALTFEARCLIHEPAKYHQNVPPARDALSHTRTEKFVDGLLNSEGPALLREVSTREGLADPYDFCHRLEGRLEWHTRRVGIKLSEMKVQGLSLPPEPV